MISSILTSVLAYWLFELNLLELFQLPQYLPPAFFLICNQIDYNHSHCSSASSSTTPPASVPTGGRSPPPTDEGVGKTTKTLHASFESLSVSGRIADSNRSVPRYPTPSEGLVPMTETRPHMKQSRPQEDDDEEITPVTPHKKTKFEPIVPMPNEQPIGGSVEETNDPVIPPGEEEDDGLLCHEDLSDLFPTFRPTARLPGETVQHFEFEAAEVPTQQIQHTDESAFARFGDADGQTYDDDVSSSPGIMQDDGATDENSNDGASIIYSSADEAMLVKKSAARRNKFLAVATEVIPNRDRHLELLKEKVLDEAEDAKHELLSLLDFYMSHELELAGDDFQTLAAMVLTFAAKNEEQNFWQFNHFYEFFTDGIDEKKKVEAKKNGIEKAVKLETKLLLKGLCLPLMTGWKSFQNIALIHPQFRADKKDAALESWLSDRGPKFEKIMSDDVFLNRRFQINKYFEATGWLARLVLDYQSLNFQPSVLAAGVFSLTCHLDNDRLEIVTGYTKEQLCYVCSYILDFERTWEAFASMAHSADKENEDEDDEGNGKENEEYDERIYKAAKHEYFLQGQVPLSVDKI
ncbi:hypothetical protein HDU76_006095, partial [Blyttiomyces sp. JEL0837]